MATPIQTCYRHPDRRAGVICQRCDRPICPSCMTQASVGFHCPECAQTGRQKVYSAQSMTTRPVMTLILVAINAVVFLAQMATVGDRTGSLGQVGLDGALAGPPVGLGDWWRPITAGFIHDGVFHIGLNMFILWQLGMLLEPALGRISYVALYFMSLLGGSALVLVLSPDALTVGASGAVYGLLGAAFVGLRSRGIDPFSTAIGPLIVINLIFTFVFSARISVGGHVGGLLAGAAGGWLLFELPSRVKNPNAKSIATGICAVAAVVLFGLCLVLGESSVPDGLR